MIIVLQDNTFSQDDVSLLEKGIEKIEDRLANLDRTATKP